MSGRVVRYVDRLVWLKQVQRDHEGLPPSALSIALVIVDHVDEHGEAFPSQPTMAEITGLNVRAVRRATDALAERGHLAVKVTRGRNTFNRYVPLWLPSTLRAPSSPEVGAENRTARAGFTADGEAKNRTDRADFEAGKPDISSTKTGQSEHENRTQRAAYQTLDQTLRPDDAREGASDVRVGMSDDALRALAIQAAGGNVEADSPGIQKVQPLRAWIAEGFDLDRQILPAISANVAGYREPLRTWKAGWLDKAVRKQSATDQSAEATSTAAKPADHGPRRRTPAGADWPEATIVRTVASGIAGGAWPEDWGPRPGRPGCQVDADLVERGRQAVREAVAGFGADGSWPSGLGPRPDDPRSTLAPDFVAGVTLRDGRVWTELALDRHLRRLAVDFAADWEREITGTFRALPSPFDAEDCSLPTEWQVKALEYRTAIL